MGSRLNVKVQYDLLSCYRFVGLECVSRCRDDARDLSRTQSLLGHCVLAWVLIEHLLLLLAGE